MPGPGLVRVRTPNGAYMETTPEEAARLSGGTQPPSPGAPQPPSAPGAPGSMFVPGLGNTLTAAPSATAPPASQINAAADQAPTRPAAQPVFAGGGASGAGGVLPQNMELRQRFIPGGPARDVRTGYSVRSTPGVELPEGTMDEIRRGDEDAYAATLHSGKVDSVRDEALAGNLSGLQDTLAGRERDRRGNEDDRIRRVDEMRQGYLRELQGATSVTVDPDRRNTGQQVLSGIAAFLDGLAGSSDVMNHIQQTLAADMEAQRDRIRQGETRVRGTQTAYEMARQQMGDERGAEQAATAYEMEAAAREAERIGLMASSATVRDRATVLASEFRRQALMQYMALEQARMGQQEMSEQFRRQGGGGGLVDEFVSRNPDGTTSVYRVGPAGSAMTPQRAAAATAYGMRPTDMPAGGAAEPLSESAENRVSRTTETIGGVQRATAVIDQLRKMDQDIGGPLIGAIPLSWASAERERMETAVAELRNSIVRASARGEGRLSDADVERFFAEIPNIMRSNPDTRREIYRRMEANLIAGQQAAIASLSSAEAAEADRRAARIAASQRRE